MNEPEELLFFDYQDEIRLFNLRNPAFVKLLPEFNKVMDHVLIQVRTNTGDHLGIVIHMLLRSSLRHYEAIVHLSLCGHGFSALRILRSFFEKYVDARYIHDNPEQIEDFWDYLILTTHDKVKPFTADEQRTIERFYIDNPKRRQKRRQWSKSNFVEKAATVGFSQSVIDGFYRHPSGFIHSSMEEISGSFVIEADNTLSPATGATPYERETADYCVHVATPLAFGALGLLIEHFKLTEPENLDSLLADYLKG